MKIGVIGLGKVGLPTASCLAGYGHTVVGFDVNAALMEMLLDGINPLPWEPGVDIDTINFVTDLRGLVEHHPDAVYIIVPTPKIGGFLCSDLVRQVLSGLDECQYDGLRIIGSTLDPRDADEVCRGQFVYNPPLIRLGHVVEDMQSAKISLVGYRGDPGTVDQLCRVLCRVWQRTPMGAIVDTPRTIAIAKLAINVTLSLKIAWANELASVCRWHGVPESIVIQAVGSDPRIGSSYFEAGWPASGPCLPRDLETWVSFARTRMADAVVDRNARTRNEKLAEAYTCALRLSKNKRVGVLGLVYNPRALDVTYSFGVALTRRFLDLGWEVLAYDPMQESLKYLGLPLGASMQAVVDQSDIVFITTPWPEFYSPLTESKRVDLTGRVGAVALPETPTDYREHWMY